MFVRIFNWYWGVIAIFFVTAASLWAQGEGAASEDETQVWVLSYAIMIAFLALTLVILLRPTKRNDSAFSYDELQAQKEEEMKKIKGTH
jgi:NADH:ubiquinone oxidoreductase subunit 6 (subunit J)